jgi:hypothetical protein
VIKAATNVAKVGEQCFGRQVVEAYRLTFGFGKPFVVNRLNNHPVKVVLNAEVGFVFNAFSLVFRDLSFLDDFVRVDGSWVGSWVHRDQKSCTILGESDVLCVVNYHDNVAMLSASILGCDAASGIG